MRYGKPGGVCANKNKNIPATSRRQKQAMRDFSHRFEANIACELFIFYFYVTQSCISLARLCVCGKSHRCFMIMRSYFFWGRGGIAL